MRFGLLLFGVVACAPRAQVSPPATTSTDASPPSAQPAPLRRRVFAPEQGRNGIAYGPYRDGQHPDHAQPTEAQLLEDLQILDPGFDLIRVYGAGDTSKRIVELIDEHDLGLGVLLGAWIAPDAAEANVAEVDRAIALANAHPDVIVAVAVGNETQVDWSAHRSPLPDLVVQLDRVRGAVKQPVTTADDYNFWNKPEAQEVAPHVDFILCHAHPLWNGKQVAEATPWTAATIADIESRHPGIPVVVGEVGWATAKETVGEQGRLIVAPADDASQVKVWKELAAWSEERGQPWFWFEAFDEPWKGGEGPQHVEKHWGLYRVDRTPKPALAAVTGDQP